MARRILAVLATVAFATPALAQFGTIFGEPPPRPPANIPGDDRFPQRPIPQPQEPPPQAFPQQPLPPPGFPQAGRPGLPPPPGSLQTQPLPPPPGVAQPPAAPPGAPPAAALPGLPPGQRQPRGTPQPASTAPQPGDEMVTELPAQKIINNTAVFAGLDKITGRITAFDVALNETVQFGALQVTPRVCYTRPPTETPNTDSFLEVDEITLQGEIKRIFTGWMFASSPGLHAIEHPIYDVWLTDCKAPTGPAVAAAEAPAAPPPRPAQQKQQRPRQTLPPPPPLPPGPFIR